MRTFAPHQWDFFSVCLSRILSSPYMYVSNRIDALPFRCLLHIMLLGYAPLDKIEYDDSLDLEDDTHWDSEEVGTVQWLVG